MQVRKNNFSTFGIVQKFLLSNSIHNLSINSCFRYLKICSTVSVNYELCKSCQLECHVRMCYGHARHLLLVQRAWIGKCDIVLLQMVWITLFLKVETFLSHIMISKTNPKKLWVTRLLHLLYLPFKAQSELHMKTKHLL